MRRWTLGGPRGRSAWLHRLWLPGLLAAAGACWLAPLGVGQLPIIQNSQADSDAPLPRINNGTPPGLGAPIEAPAGTGKTPPGGIAAAAPPIAPPQAAAIAPPSPRPWSERPVDPLPMAIKPPRPAPVAKKSAKIAEPAALAGKRPPKPGANDAPRLVEASAPIKPAAKAPVHTVQAPPVAPAATTLPVQAEMLPAATAAAMDVPLPTPLRLPHFGRAIGVGAAPAPVWIGPTEEPDSETEEMPPTTEPASPAPVSMPPVEPPVEAPPTPLEMPVEEIPFGQEAERPEPLPPSSAPLYWTQYQRAFPAQYSYRIMPYTPTVAQPPFGWRLREWAIWPFRVLAEPFRD